MGDLEALSKVMEEFFLESISMLERFERGQEYTREVRGGKRGRKKENSFDLEVFVVVCCCSR